MLFKPEKCFLVLFTSLAFISLLCTSMAFFLDKHAITGTEQHPAMCMLTHSTDCRTVYTSELVRNMVEVHAGVDLILSCIAFTSGVILFACRIFNVRLLIAALLIGIFKTIFMNSALILILTNTDYYFNTVFNTLTGTCGHELCWEQDNTNIVVSFILLLASGTATFLIMITVFGLGNQILVKYDQEKDDVLWIQWDQMSIELF